MDKKDLIWEKVRENLKLTKEQEEEIRVEEEIIEAVVRARKEKNLTQQQLSDISGIKQPAIARIENGTNSPMVSTLMKMLYSMGYTLKVVPLEKKRTP